MKKTMLDSLIAAAFTLKRPDGSDYRALRYDAECMIAQAHGCSLRAVQIEALKNNILPERYVRNQNSLTSRDQIRLLESRVAVVGLGGLGGTVTEILVRIGVGSLTLIDGDVFDESNLNRQLLSNMDSLGQSKAAVAAKRVAAVNPAVEVRPHALFLDRDNCEMMLQDADVAVDCLDSIPARFLLQDGCRIANIPMVSAAIGGTSGQATVIMPENKGLERLYGDRDTVAAKGAEKSIGTLPFSAVLMAAVECAEVTALLIGRGSRLSNSLFMTDLSDYSSEIMEFLP